MSWDDSGRKDRLPENWWSLRQQVFKRDGNRCTWRLKSGKRCPRPATDVDHRVAGDDHSLGNLQALCGTHHARKSSFEGHAAKSARKALRFRTPEAHPGRLR